MDTKYGYRPSKPLTAEEWTPSEVVFMFAGFLSTLPAPGLRCSRVDDSGPVADAAAAFIMRWRLDPPRHGFADVMKPWSSWPGSQTGLTWERRR